MGCCISTNRTRVATTTKKAKKLHVSKSKHTRKKLGGSPRKSPPPILPLSDEETVKEVLSETPSVPKQPPHLLQKTESPFIKATPFLPDFSKPPDEKRPNGDAVKKPLTAFGDNGIPEEVLEICSTVDGGVDVSAKASTEKIENIGVENDDVREVGRRSPARFKNRPPPGEVKRDKTLGKSRPAPSLDRSKPGSVSSSGYGRRRADAGEVSGRRSRSPVSRVDCGSSRTDLGRSPSSRRTGKSPGRVGSGLGDKLRKVDEGGSDKWPPTSNESFENPVVSLECFIFL